MIPYQQQAIPDWLRKNVEQSVLVKKKRLTRKNDDTLTTFCGSFASSPFCRSPFSSPDLSHEIESRQISFHLLKYSIGFGSPHHWRLGHDNFAQGCSTCDSTSIGMHHHAFPIIVAVNKTIDLDKQPLDGAQIEFRMDWIR